MKVVIAERFFHIIAKSTGLGSLVSVFRGWHC